MLETIPAQLVEHCKPKVAGLIHTKTASETTPIKKKSKLKSFLFIGLDEELVEYSLSSTWEWREGRLFAYELILKYLIANHIHYVFPSYAFSYSPRQASCSVDEAMLKR